MLRGPRYVLPLGRGWLACVSWIACGGLAVASAAEGCRPATSGQSAPERPAKSAPATAHPVSSDARAALAPDAGLDGATATERDAGVDARAAAFAALLADASTDPMAIHQETREGLLSLFSIKDFTEKQKKVIRPDRFLRHVFGTNGPGRISQGNKALAQHAISRKKCLEGLKDVVIQTPEQREICGAENMVPVWIKGKKPWFCIDVFEFPNKACELPMVWAPPTWDKKVCELQGKRLCSDIEWNIACRGDPEGGDDQRYAYGDKLDLEICNTNKRHHGKCSAHDAKTAWNTCATDTEPAGSFPQCRSRFGVFDQHGNVAEVMMRRQGDTVYTQLKGSAWFYTELAKEPGEPVPESTTNKKGAYPDHCNFDPRWHVEKINSAWHVNYHLGFRCCKSIP